MKVLLVHNNYQTNNIGGEDIVYQNEVTTLKDALGEDSLLIYEVFNDNINRFTLILSIFFSITHFLNIFKIVKRNKIDIVHVHNFFPVLTPSVFIAASMAGAKVVHTLHNFRKWCISGILYREDYGICELCVGKTFPLSGIKFSCYRKSKIQSLLAQASFSFYKVMRFYNFVDVFFVLTDFQRTKVLSLGVPDEKIVLKPNGAKPVTHCSKTKSGYIYVGRLEKAKGLEELLQVWKKLDSNFQLKIIGEGELGSLIRDLNLSNVTFMGRRSHSEVVELISSSKYLIQPSLLYETFGLTIIEAMSCGTPVIGFNIGTRSDFIQHDVSGLLCDPSELEATVIKSMYEVNYLHMSKQAILVASRFTNERITQVQIAAYSELLGRS